MSRNYIGSDFLSFFHKSWYCLSLKGKFSHTCFVFLILYKRSWHIVLHYFWLKYVIYWKYYCFHDYYLWSFNFGIPNLMSIFFKELISCFFYISAKFLEILRYIIFYYNNSSIQNIFASRTIVYDNLICWYSLMSIYS